MYRCDGCGRDVAGTAADPIHWPGARKLCTSCLHTPVTSEAKSAEVKSTSKGDAARARWAAMSDEAKAAHVAKMQAGRGIVASKPRRKTIVIE